MNTDPVADMLNRIRNAQAVALPGVEVPFSQLKYALAKVLQTHGFVKQVETQKRKGRAVIEIRLKYTDAVPAIGGVKRISKGGQKFYAPAKKINRVKGGHGIAVISTSKGLMSDKDARKQGVGGEILCEIW